MIRPPVVLLGLDCRTGLQAARVFASRGLEVFGVAGDGLSPYCRTRAVRGVLEESEFRADPVRWLRPLTHGARLPVLLPCSDEFTLWLDAHRDALAGVASWVLPSDSLTLTTLVDKAKLAVFAAAQGIRAPRTSIVSDRRGAAAVCSELEFPVILKPTIRTARWLAATGGRKVVRIDSAEYFLDTYDRCAPAVPQTIVQEWIPGPDSRMYSVFSHRTRDGQIAATLVVQKLRQWPPDVGVASLAMQVDDDEIEAFGCDVLARAGFAGLSSVQVKRHDRTGEPYLIEVNAGRPALSMAIAEHCGVDLHMSYYCDAAGLPLPHARTVTRPGSKWICWKTDAGSAIELWRRGDLGAGEWWRSVSGRKTHAVWSLRDPLPFVFDLVHRAQSVLRPAAASPSVARSSPQNADAVPQ